MASLPETSSGSGATPSLAAGLAALKQGQYHQAIALLEPCVQGLTGVDRVRAQMALVMAYSRGDQLEQALAFCQQLRQDANPKVREWADRTLSELSPPAPQQGSVPDQTGFVPLSAPPPDTPRPVPSPPERRSSARPSQPPPIPRPDPMEDAGEPTVLQTATGESIPPQRPPQTRPPSPDPPPPRFEEAAVEEPFSYQPEWKQASRAKQWHSLGRVDVSWLWLAQAVTGVSLALLIYGLWVCWNGITAIPGQVASRVFYWQVEAAGYEVPVSFILGALAVLLVASPWLLDTLLRFAYGLEPFSLQSLAVTSPESSRLVQQFCRQRRLPLPRLGLLPSSEPLIFTYGCLPRFARIVVSRGLLNQLAEDEIATLYAGELSHIAYRDFIPLSLVMVVLQLPYSFYAALATGGDRLRARSDQMRADQPILAALMGYTAELAALGAAIAYGLFWLFRWPGFWLARKRAYYSDRAACEATGNPNGLSRGLLKLAIGLTKAIERQGYTSYLVEGFDLLTPLSYRMALTLGSLYPHAPLEPILEWDQVNPSGPWYALGQSHPLIGDRLRLLALYARHWRLESELTLPGAQRSKKPDLRPWKRLLMQGAPWFGMAFGVILAAFLWVIGLVARRRGIDSLVWLWTDHSFLTGFVLIGFGLGTLLRFNRFFPDEAANKTGAAWRIRRQGEASGPGLPDLLADPQATPGAPQFIQLQGNLLGRRGMGNWLCQDLLLQTKTGLVKLHYFTATGPIGNLLPQTVRPVDLTDQPVTITGWFRRGVTPWIDTESVQTAGGRTARGSHQAWSTILGLATVIIGLLLMVWS